MVWLIILVALGFILGAIMALKYTANMEMKIPKEIEYQFNNALHLDAGEHAKALPDDDKDDEQREDNNEYDKNPMPEDVKKHDKQ